MTPREQFRSEGQAILRVARELREFLIGAPAADEQARSLLADVAVLERVGNWLATAEPIDATNGIPAAASPEHAPGDPYYYSDR